MTSAHDALVFVQVCVCVYLLKRSKPVLVLGDLFPGDLLRELHDCTSFRDDTHFHQQVFT